MRNGFYPDSENGEIKYKAAQLGQEEAAVELLMFNFLNKETKEERECKLQNLNTAIPHPEYRLKPFPLLDL